MELIQRIAVSAQVRLMDLGKSLRREEGQTFTEYALILSLVVLVAIAGYALLGSKIKDLVSNVANSL